MSDLRDEIGYKYNNSGHLDRLVEQLGDSEGVPRRGDLHARDELHDGPVPHAVVAGSVQPGRRLPADRPHERVQLVDAPVAGICDTRFASVQEEFARNFAERGEIGAAVCVMVDGTPVVDLAGGWRDEARVEPWRPDTLVDVYSVGKAVVALLALQSVDQGLLGLDDPVASVWPEFAAGGKETATVRHALCHRAGVPAIREPLSNDDLWHWGRMASALAATDAWWEPGSRHVYHTNTYGHLIGEVVRIGRPGSCPGIRLRSVVGPLGAEISSGVPPVAAPRCAEVLFAASGDGVRGDGLSGDLQRRGADGEPRAT